MKSAPIVIEQHTLHVRRQTHVEYRIKQGRIQLASTAPTREGAEALALSLARLLGVCLFYRETGESGPATLIADYTRDPGLWS